MQPESITNIATAHPFLKEMIPVVAGQSVAGDRDNFCCFAPKIPTADINTLVHKKMFTGLVP
jgi:hypothetical protein